jgi:predicted permease
MAIFRRRRTRDDFADEIRAHLELETDRLVAEGCSPDAARDAARRSFGNVTAVQERFYEESRWTWIEQLAQDLRYGLRGLLRSPSFVATTVLTLAVGLGLVTVAFTVVNAYVLRPYAVRDPSRLHQVAWRSPEAGGQSFQWRDYEALRDRRDLFDAVIAEYTRFVSSDGRPLAAALVSDNYFDALGPAIPLGRPLVGADIRGASGGAVVLSHQAWSRLFARDPAVVGREIDLNGRAFVIVGVVAPEFTGLGDMPRDLWVSLTSYAALADPALVGPGGARRIQITARLRQGVSAEAAQSALTPFMAGIVAGTDNVRAEVRPQPSPNRLSLELVALLAPVFAAFGLVLVTACANVSNVLLARALARHREIAVRLSLGASRGRVIRQLLTEGLLLSVLSGIAGLVLASWLLHGATVLFFSTLPPSVAAILRLAPMGIDHRVFLFAQSVAAAATLLFALLPAVRASRLTVIGALRGHGGGPTHASRLRGALVTGQVAVSLVLVIVAVTLARNGAAIGAIDLGYETRGVISVNVRGDDNGLVRPLAAVLASDPRVAEMAVTGGNPLFERSRAVAAAPAQSGPAVAMRYTFVSPEYFPILRIPIERGRGFRLDEARAGAPVGIVSAATANALWPGEDPIGKTVRIERPEGRPVDELQGYSMVTIVGTVRDVVSGLLVDGLDSGHIYLPTSATDTHAVALLIRGRSDRDVAPAALQQLFRQVGTDPEAFEALPLDEMRALQMYPLLAASWIGALLSAVALVLSVSGLYGVMTFTLGQRTKEIGIRMALGATAGAVVRLVMRQSLRLAGVGAIIGLVTTVGVMMALGAVIRLRTVSFLDIVAFGGGLALVMAAAALAAYHPARRATRVDPSQTLRADA